MKILALAICDTMQKIQYLDIFLLAAGPLITVSLKGRCHGSPVHFV